MAINLPVEICLAVSVRVAQDTWQQRLRDTLTSWFGAAASSRHIINQPLVVTVGSEAERREMMLILTETVTYLREATK